MNARILLVEDDYAIIRGLKDSFVGHGYEVSTAMDGESAIQAAKTERFDLILLDVMLPKLNGFEVCQAVREAELDTPIIMLTAKGEDEDVVRGLNLGADDYITKPFSIKQLHAKCQAFLRRYKVDQSGEYNFGHFTFNTESRTLMDTRSTQAIALTPKEYALLHLFLRRQGHALTRETILTAVWGDSFLTTLRSVDRCVTTLRKKIEANPKRPEFIQMVRDVGYRFNAD